MTHTWGSIRSRVVAMVASYELQPLQETCPGVFVLAKFLPMLETCERKFMSFTLNIEVCSILMSE